MPIFTPEQARRWDEWQRASALSAQRGDRLRRVLGITVFVVVVAWAIVVWQR